MTPTDAFSAQIVQLVRRMPDEAILALVKNQLAGVKVLSQSFPTVAKGRPGRPAGSKNAPKPVSAAPAAALANATQSAPKAAKGKPGRKPGPKPKAAKAAKAPKANAAKKGAAKKSVGRPAGKKAAKPGRRTRQSGAGRNETLALVERVVKASHGMAASDVAKAASIPQSRAAAALKELKMAKRIHQGGDRRFARYAGDAKSAEAASMAARNNAAGPRGGKKKK